MKEAAPRLDLKAFSANSRPRPRHLKKARTVFRRCGGLGQSKALDRIAAIFFCARHGFLDGEP